MHVHTENPGEVLSWGTHFGSLVKVKVDNMRDQQQAVIDEQRTEAVQATKVIPNVTTVVNTAVITIAAGEGCS